MEIGTAFGVATGTLTVTYTDQDGNAGASASIAKTVLGTAGQMLPATLAAGDYGVQAVTNYSWSVTQTSGAFGLVLLKRIVTIPLPQVNVGVVYDAFSSGLREIPDDACLAFMVQCSTTNTGLINGELTIAKG
jgi:hypothetical protein